MLCYIFTFHTLIHTINYLSITVKISICRKGVRMFRCEDTFHKTGIRAEFCGHKIRTVWYCKQNTSYRVPLTAIFKARILIKMVLKSLGNALEKLCCCKFSSKKSKRTPVVVKHTPSFEEQVRIIVLVDVSQP